MNPWWLALIVPATIIGTVVGVTVWVRRILNREVDW